MTYIFMIQIIAALVTHGENQIPIPREKPQMYITLPDECHEPEDCEVEL